MRRRRGRNSPWGSTVAESEYARQPRRRRSRPKVRNHRSGVSGVYLGTLEFLELENGRVIKKPGKHIAWMPSSNDLALVKKAHGRPAALSTTVRRIHREFHESAPQRAVVFDWPDRVGKLRLVGLVRVISYIVPASVKSPGKRQPDGGPILWVHAFGDHGESGHGSVDGTREKKYPPRLMPALVQDEAGHLYIKRRPGNRYNVSKWMYW